MSAENEVERYQARKTKRLVTDDEAERIRAIADSPACPPTLRRDTYAWLDTRGALMEAGDAVLRWYVDESPRWSPAHEKLSILLRQLRNKPIPPHAQPTEGQERER